MAQDGKLDLLLKMMAENEKKREEAEARTRADFAELKLSLDVRLPAVEKKVETLNTVCKTLSAKVEQLEGSIALQRKDDEFAGKVTTAAYPEAHKEEPQDSRNFQSTPLHHGMRDSTLISPIPFPHDDSAFQSSSHGQSSALVYSIPPMTFPQFNGDNPQMWKANYEIYFDVYGIHPRNWVKVATLNFCGNAAFWLQSVRSQLAGAMGLNCVKESVQDFLEIGSRHSYVSGFVFLRAPQYVIMLRGLIALCISCWPMVEPMNPFILSLNLWMV